MRYNKFFFGVLNLYAVAFLHRKVASLRHSIEHVEIGINRLDELSVGLINSHLPFFSYQDAFTIVPLYTSGSLYYVFNYQVVTLF